MSPAQRSPEVHTDLYERFQKVIGDLIPDDRDLSRSTLWHRDFHSRNIFVQHGKVTALIDWRDCWAGPLFLQAQEPAFVRYAGERMLYLPEHYESIPDEEEKAALRRKVQKSAVQWAYEADTEELNPLLHRVYRLPQGKMRQELVDFAANTWDGDILPFREILIRVVK